MREVNKARRRSSWSKCSRQATKANVLNGSGRGSIASNGPVSTYCGRSRPRPWMPQLGGKRAYSGRLGKDRSLDESQHSSASPKWGLPSIETLADVSWTACWAICGPRGLRTQAPRRVQVHGNYGATIVSEETILTASSRHFRRCADRRAWQWGFKRSSPCGSSFQRPAALETGRDLARTAAFGQNHADPVASAWDPVAAAASRP